MSLWSRPSDLASALATDPVLRAVVGEAVTDAGRPALLAPQRDVGNVDRHLLVDDAALHDLTAGLRVAFHHVHAVDDHTVGLVHDPRDRAAPAAVFPREDDDL